MTSPSLSPSRSFRLSLFSSSIAYRAIGGEDSSLVSPLRSLRFSHASSRGTDWTIHHCCFFLRLSLGSFVFLRFRLSFYVLSNVYCQGVGHKHTYVAVYTLTHTHIKYYIRMTHAYIHVSCMYKTTTHVGICLYRNIRACNTHTYMRVYYVHA